MPSSLLRAAPAWTRVTRTWTSARTTALRTRIRASPALGPSTCVVSGDVNALPAANLDCNAPAFSTSPIMPPAFHPTSETTVPFKFDFEFVKPIDDPAWLAPPKPTSRPPSSKKGSLYSKARRPHSHPSTNAAQLPFGHNGIETQVAPLPFQPINLNAFVFLQQQQQLILQAEQTAKMLARAQAVQRIRVACAMREYQALETQYREGANRHNDNEAVGH